MLFDGHKESFYSFVLLKQSVVIFTVQLSFVVASLRVSAKKSTELKFLNCSQLERLVY